MFYIRHSHWERIIALSDLVNGIKGLSLAREGIGQRASISINIFDLSGHVVLIIHVSPKQVVVAVVIYTPTQQ